MTYTETDARRLERLAEEQRRARDFIATVTAILDPQAYRPPGYDRDYELTAALMDYLTDETDEGGAPASAQVAIEDVKRWLLDTQGGRK